MGLPWDCCCCVGCRCAERADISAMRAAAPTPGDGAAPAAKRWLEYAVRDGAEARSFASSLSSRTCEVPAGSATADACTPWNCCLSTPARPRATAVDSVLAMCSAGGGVGGCASCVCRVASRAATALLRLSTGTWYCWNRAASRSIDDVGLEEGAGLGEESVECDKGFFALWRSCTDAADASSTLLDWPRPRDGKDGRGVNDPCLVTPCAAACGDALALRLSVRTAGVRSASRCTVDKLLMPSLGCLDGEGLRRPSVNDAAEAVSLVSSSYGCIKRRGCRDKPDGCGMSATYDCSQQSKNKDRQRTERCC